MRRWNAAVVIAVENQFQVERRRRGGDHCLLLVHSPFCRHLLPWLHVDTAAVDLAQLHTGYICKSCTFMIDTLHKKVNAKFPGAIPILPRIAQRTEL